MNKSVTIIAAALAAALCVAAPARAQSIGSMGVNATTGGAPGGPIIGTRPHYDERTGLPDGARYQVVRHHHHDVHHMHNQPKVVSKQQ